MFANAADPDGTDNLLGTADDGLRLTMPSLAINGGSAALLPADRTDLDLDGNLTEVLPFDVLGNPRALDGIPEMGAYEYEATAMSLAYWRSLHFSASDRADPAKEASVWGDYADPDGDHVPNCGEYLLLLNPAAHDSPLENLPIIQWWGMDWLQIDYTVGKDRTEVSLTTEYSEDLTPGSWGDVDQLHPPFPHYLLDETATTSTWELLVPAYRSCGFVRMGFTVNP